MSNEYTLDAIDREILSHLRRDGRLTNVRVQPRYRENRP
ncbi:winged helix-turn-helix transcriptional regulator [Streptosporangium vulgare]|uniref:Winged helix-turn-helix transcriptional regulator n=1 Tax=Streptosporangium vulgare TaxID=46190 RepID=A0ABV5TSR1_9ACTN